jgi:hypothetical protein
MSFNANTQYKAIDLQQLANECRQAIEGRSSSTADQWEGEDLHQWPLEASLRGFKADVG